MLYARQTTRCRLDRLIIVTAVILILGSIIISCIAGDDLRRQPAADGGVVFLEMAAMRPALQKSHQPTLY